MNIFQTVNHHIGSLLIRDFDDTADKAVRVKHAMLAGWASIFSILTLFVVKMILGLMSGSISVIADAFHLLSHLANSVILLVSFWLTTKPATEKTPFGHGRMEHVAPLIMSVFLFVAGIQIGEKAVHNIFLSHAPHYWPALPWILLATIVVKEMVGQFVRFLGERVQSHAILANAAHHRIEAVVSLTVVAGLLVGKQFHWPQIDGIIGLLVSLLLLYLGFDHGREAIIPILGKAPGKDMTDRIREIARSVEGVVDVHEIIIHDYGSMYLISLHVEIPEKLGPVAMHEIAERCEHELRRVYGGAVVCHTDPLMEMTPEIEAIENRFKALVEASPSIKGYHDFRVVAESKSRVILIADIDAETHVPEKDFEGVASDLESRVKTEIPHTAYCSFYVTPRFSY